MNFDFSYLDVAFKNGSVVTVNERDEIAQAVGVKGNRIVFVGTNEDIDRLIDHAGDLLACSLNMALHPGMTFAQAEGLG